MRAWKGCCRGEEEQVLMGVTDEDGGKIETKEPAPTEANGMKREEEFGSLQSSDGSAERLKTLGSFP